MFGLIKANKAKKLTESSKKESLSNIIKLADKAIRQSAVGFKSSCDINVTGMERVADAAALLENKGYTVFTRHTNITDDGEWKSVMTISW